MQSIRKNYLYSISYQILAIIIPLVTVPYLTRTIGAEKLGVYAYTNSVAYYFLLASMLGMSNYGNRTIAACRDNQDLLNRRFSELLKMQLSFGFIVLISYAAYLTILYLQNKDLFIPSVIWGLYIVSGVFDISWFYWGIEKFSVTVLKNIVIKIVTTLGIFLFIRSSEDLYVYISLIASSSFICSLAVWTQLRKNVKYIHVSFRQAYQHFRGNLILFIPVIAVSIYTVMDKVMLGNLSPMKELGFYDNIQKIMTLPTGIITALGAVMLPRISNLVAKGDNDHALSLMTLSMQFSNFSSIALAFGLASVAPTFTVVYFGAEFVGTSIIMELFTVTVIFISWANVIRTQHLIPQNRDKIYIVSVIAGALINLIINLMLIPKLNALGAVIGTICAELAVAVIQTVAVKDELPIKDFLRDGMLFFIPGIVMMICVRLICNYLGLSLLSLVVQIISGAIIYLLLGLFIVFRRKMGIGNEIKKTIMRIKKHGV